MMAVTAQMRVLVCVEAVDFRKGIDGLALDAHQDGPTCAHENRPTARCRIFLRAPGSGIPKILTPSS
jgi:hypothetical protein